MLTSDIDVVGKSIDYLHRAKLAVLRAWLRGARFHLTSKGVHILIKDGDDRNFDERLFYCDDINRVMMDEERIRHGIEIGVLFVAKNGKRVVETDNVDSVLEHLDYVFFNVKAVRRWTGWGKRRRMVLRKVRRKKQEMMEIMRYRRKLL